MSQPISQMKARKHHVELDWVFIIALVDSDIYQYLNNLDYKMTATHTAILRKCNSHENQDEHSMKVSYYRCSSKHCIQSKSDQCDVRMVIKRCEQNLLNHIYKVI